MEGTTVVKQALVLVRKALKARGFSARGASFFRRMPSGNTIVLCVQKSVKSSVVETEVTVNYGVYCARLGSKLEEDPSSAFDVTRTHWRERLRENGREKWLHLHSTFSAEMGARVILDAVDAVLPELLEHASDEVLRDEWLSGSSPGLTEMERLLFAAILVNEIGPKDMVGVLVAQLRELVSDRPNHGLVELRLARAGVAVA